VSTTILVVEDDDLMGSSLCRALNSSGYSATHVFTLAEARNSFSKEKPDLVLLDLSLPDGDGLDFCSELQRIDPSVPVIMLTARVEEIDIVVGLSVGAVDYVTKPFQLAVLIARVEAHLRTAAIRSEPHEDSNPNVHLFCFDVELDAESRRVMVDGTEVELRAREFDLLERLMRDAGKVVRRDTLIADVWDENWFGSTKTLDVHIAHLRRKLGEDAGSSSSRISSIRGIGYRFEVDSPKELT
jgi:DNA-binding response OmpR family regulator